MFGSKEKGFAGLVVATVVSGYLYFNHKGVANENIHPIVQEKLNTQAEVATNTGNKNDALQELKDKQNKSNEVEFFNMTNELLEAKLITGVEYFINDAQQTNQTSPTLINFKYKDKNCVALGEIKPDSQKSAIRLNYAKCDNEEFKIEGVFFDANKNFGSVSIFNSDNQKYMVPPQDGFFLIYKVLEKLDTSSKNIPNLQLLNAELRTSALINNSTEHIPVLVSFVNNGIICNSLGDISSVNGISSIMLKNYKCGDELHNESIGWFIGTNKILNPNEEIIDKETNQRTIPLQSGYVLFSR